MLFHNNEVLIYGSPLSLEDFPKNCPTFLAFQCACFLPLSSIFFTHSVRIMQNKTNGAKFFTERDGNSTSCSLEMDKKTVTFHPAAFKQTLNPPTKWDRFWSLTEWDGFEGNLLLSIISSPEPKAHR